MQMGDTEIKKHFAEIAVKVKKMCSVFQLTAHSENCIEFG